MAEYIHLYKNIEENEALIFVLYLSEEFKISFDPNETFSVNRISYEIYTNENNINYIY